MILALSVVLTASGWLITIRDPHPQDYAIEAVYECYEQGRPFRAVNQRDFDRPGHQRLITMRQVPTPKGQTCAVWFFRTRRLSLFSLPWVMETFGTTQRL